MALIPSIAPVSDARITTLAQSAIAAAATTPIDASRFVSIQAALDSVDPVMIDDLEFRGGVVACGFGLNELDETLVIPQGFQLVGKGAEATSFKASADFPVDTPLVQLGSEVSVAEHNIILRDLLLDCDSVPGSTGVYSRVVQETSMLDRVTIIRPGKRGVHIVSDTGGYQPNHFELRDVQIFPASTETTDAMVEADGLGMALILTRTSLVQDPGPATHVPVGLKAQNCDVVFHQLHVEGCDVGVHVTLGDTNRGALFGSYLTGNVSVDTLLKVSDLAPTDVHFIRDLGSTISVDYTVDYTSVGARQLTGYVHHFCNQPSQAVYAPESGVMLGGKWDGQHLVMVAYLQDWHFWIDDTGSLRMKSGAPTSSTDGATVGSQT